MSPIEAGQPVPDFTLPRDGGGETGPADFKGRKLVIYFYPKDDTSGCTLEAIDFSARIADFEAADTTVLGISKDSVKSHDRFRDKHGLKVILLSDDHRRGMRAVRGLGREVDVRPEVHGNRALDLPR